MSEANVKFSFRSKTPNDCIPDSTVAEVVERLIATVGPIQSGVAFSVTPPTNKNVIWVPLDVNGNRAGPDRRYNFQTSQWVDDSDFEPFCAAPGADNLLERVGDCWLVRRRRYESITFSVTGNGQQVLELDEPIPGDYMVSITPTNSPGNVRVWEASRTSGTVTIGVAGWTSGTQTFKLEVMQR